MINLIIYLITLLLEAGVAFYYIDSIFVRRRKWSTVLIMFLISVIFQFVCVLLKQPVLNAFLSMMFNCIIIYFFYKKEIFYAAFHSVLLIVLMAVTELVASSALGILENYYEKIENAPYILLIYFVFSKITYVLAVFLVLKLITKRRNRYESGLGIVASAMTIFASLLVIMGLFVVGFQTKLHKGGERVIIGCALVELVISVISIWLYEYTMRNNERINELQLELQSENDLLEMNQRMADLYENQQIMAHDIKNHLKVIQGYAAAKNYPEMEKYLDNLVGMPALNRKTNYSGSSRLNILLGRYENVCEGKSIALCVDIQSQKIDYILPEDMTALFGNLLDNAIEAAQGCNDPLIEVVTRGINEKLYIGVKNSCRQRPEFDENNMLISTKQERWQHGFGMKSVHKIVEKYHGEMEFSYDDMLEVFKVSILLEV